MSDTTNLSYVSDETRAQIKAALEGDSNDAEHDALYSVACELDINLTLESDLDEDE